MGGDSSDITTGVNSSKNAVENNGLARGTIKGLEKGYESCMKIAACRNTLLQLGVNFGLTSAQILAKRGFAPIMFGDKTFGDRIYNESLDDNNNNMLGGAGAIAAGGAPGLPPDDDKDKKDKDDSSNKNDKKGVGGNGAASDLPSLDGKSPDDARKLLEGQGFSSGEINPIGWQTFRGKDGSKVDINWNNGRVVRTAAPKYGPNGSRINKGQRFDSSGSEIPRNLLHELHPTETINLK